MKFELDIEQEIRAKDWFAHQKQVHGDGVGTIGDRWSYKFTPTELGVIVTLIDNLSKEELCLTDFDNW